MIPVDKLLMDKKYIEAFVSGHFRQSIINLETLFADYIGPENALFTNSCRSALYLAYKSLKLKGEVIVPPLTCSIAILPLICCGLKPSFVDIDPYTYNIDPDKINESINSNTSAIQIIPLAGNPCDINAIKEIAEDRNITLIEDCAQALGAEYQGNKVGSFGDVSCFSFTKNMYGIGGGMLLTDNKDILFRAQRHQQSFSKFPLAITYYRFIRNMLEQYRNTYFGDKLYDILLNVKGNITSDEIKDCNFLKSHLYCPSNIESSVALSQMEKIDNLLEKRVRNALILTKELKKNSDLIKFQMVTKESTHIYSKYMIETPYNSKYLLGELPKNGIDAKHLEHKHDIACQTRFDIDPFYARFKSIIGCKNYFNAHDNIVCLPISSNMDIKEIQFIANQVSNAMDNLSG